MICAALAVFGGSALAAPAYVQGGIGNDTSGNTGHTTIAVTLGSAVSSGDTVCGAVTFYYSSSGSLTSVTDDKSNTYAIIDTQPGNNSTTSFCAYNITNAPTTITATYVSDDAGYATIIADEYSGVAASPLDVHATNTQSSPSTSTNAVTSTNATTSANGDLIYGVTMEAVVSNFVTAGTGFTQRELQNTGSGATYSASSEDLVQATAGSVASTYTISSSNGTWNTFVIALKAAAPPTPGCKGAHMSMLGVGC